MSSTLPDVAVTIAAGTYNLATEQTHRLLTFSAPKKFPEFLPSDTRIPARFFAPIAMYLLDDLLRS
jgi:hypothetical protein